MEKPIDPLVRLEGVSKSSLEESWIRDVSFELHAGELVALIGPGDTGKTTLMRLILGLTQPDSGEISVFGREPGSIEALQKTGAVLDRSDFPTALKVGEVIDLVRAHFFDPAPIDHLAERCGFENELDRSVNTLSTAERRWLAILLSLAGSPNALVMDMPTLGMDVGWRRRFWNLLNSYTSEGCLAFLSTDVLHEVETFATRVIIMHRGEVVADGSAEDIIKEHGERTLSMRSESLPDLDGIRDVEWRDGGPVFHASDADTVVREMARQELAFEDLEVRRPNLEEVLLWLIQEDNV